MFKRAQGLVAGILIGVILTSGIAYAAGNTRKLDAFFNGIKIVVDGTEIHPTDATGKTVEPFIVSGTTYLPVRAIGDALGKAVYWDGPNYTVYLGNMDGKLEYPTLHFKDAIEVTRGRTEVKSLADRMDNYGNVYNSAFLVSQFANQPNGFQTLLNMKYSRFKGTFYVKQGETRNKSSSFQIELDGRIIYSSSSITKTSSPIIVDVDLTGGNDFLFRIDTSGPLIYLGDAGFYQ